MRYLRFALACFVVLSCSSAFAQLQTEPARSSGLTAILGVGARAQGMGAAFTAIADDATAASWNPAGLAQLTRPEISAVYETLDIETDRQFTITGGNSVVTGTSTVLQESEGDYSGLSFASLTYPFTMGAQSWVTQFSYRNLGSFPDVNSIFANRLVIRNAQTNEVLIDEETTAISRLTPGGNLNTYSFSLATGMMRRLNLGISINYLDASLEDQRIGGDGDLFTEDTYGFDFSELYFDAGVLFKLSDRISFGGVYHTGFEADVDTVNIFRPEGFEFSGPVEGLQSQLEWPSGWAAGVAFRPIQRFTLSADYSVTNWSDASIDEFAFVVDLDCDFDNRTCNPVAPESLSNSPFPAVFSVAQRDTSSLRFGTEYIFALNRLLLPIRAGYFTEEQLFNVFDGVDVRQEQPEYDGWSVGVGLVYNRLQLDFAYVKTEGEDIGRAQTTSDENPTDPIIIEIPRRVENASNSRFLVSAIVRF